MAYRVQLLPKAARELSELPAAIQKRIIRWLDLLGENPRRPGTAKLKGREDLYCVHAGKDYVIIYTIRDDEVIVLVLRVGHRSEAYRRLPHQ